MMQLIVTLLITYSTCLTYVVSENCKLIIPENVTRLERVVAMNKEYVIVANMVSGGSLIVYKYEDTSLTFANTFAPSDIGRSDEFGESLSINKDNFFVAGNDMNMVGINGTAYAGSINGATWTVHKLIPSKRPDDNMDRFGYDVAINDNKVIAIGAPWDEKMNGSVYIFGYSGGVGWEQKQKIMVPRKRNSWFGEVVSITNTHLLVGAPLSRKSSSGESGFVYIFKLDSNTNLWNLSDTIKPEEYIQANYGGFLKMHERRIYVGSPNTDDGLGSVYVYKSDGTNWVLETKLVACNRGWMDGFGWDASVYDNAIVVGTTKGKAYLYKYIDGNWHEKMNWRHAKSKLTTAVEMYGNTVAMMVDLKGIRMFDLNNLTNWTNSTTCNSNNSLLPYSLFSYLVFFVLYLIF